MTADGQRRDGPRPVQADWPGLTAGLSWRVRRHLAQPSRAPVPGHARQALARLLDWLEDRPGPLVLDSGCGTGAATAALARSHPHWRVVGLDQSAARLGRGQSLPDNALLLRTNMFDFWRLAADSGLRLHGHWLLYPNPWPKPGQLRRRIHGSDAFPALLALGGMLELRGNWRPYLDEFRRALAVAGIHAEVEDWQPGEPLSAFERKYAQAGHPLWRLAVGLPGTQRFNTNPAS